MPAAASRAALLLAAGLLVTPLLAFAADDPGYVWMSGPGEGNALLTYGSAETGEDYVFNLICGNKDRRTEATLYVDIAGTEIGQPIIIELAAGAAKVSLKGKIATDEMSGFHFAEAKGFKIKPVIALLKEKESITAKTGKLVTDLPDKGRAAPAAEFAKTCKLD
ncbi:MAG TPA: hypothetical protein VHK26_13195 [Methyloceanibacter sp.]|jgi:hypothetical protein|nr:hypothetical protein [Methyloceanibacter sp.]